MRQKLSQNPYYVLLFPLFFVLHGFTENFYFVSILSAVLLTIQYVIAALLLTILFYFLSRRQKRSAALVTTLALAIFLFFGDLLDFLLSNFEGSLIVRYTFLLPFFAALLIMTLLIVRRKRRLFSMTSYLNVLFLLLISFDLITLSVKIVRNNSNAAKIPAGMTYCNCPKPDIYFILVDEYAGFDQLKKQFHFDNGQFASQLDSLGFKTIGYSHSNYNYTPFSTASILNMEYLDSVPPRDFRRKGIRYATNKIDQNRFVLFLQGNGYQFYNHSVFKVAGQAAPTEGSFVPANAKLINKNTLFKRLEKDVVMNLDVRFLPTQYLKKRLFQTDKDNQAIYDLTLKVPAVPSQHPKAVYTHLMMPHYPYYYAENGEALDIDTLYRLPLHSPDRYISYLKYTNKKLLALVNHILSTSANPPIVMIVSDHGYRHDDTDPSYVRPIFSSLLSIYLPNRDYRAFTDTMSNVNFLRAVVNTSFHQKLPYLNHVETVINF